MNISSIFKTITIAGCLVVCNLAAMNWNIVESRITSILEKPLVQESVNQLSNELKRLSGPRTQKAEEFLEQAYAFLISENKLELADALLNNLTGVQALKNTVDRLEINLADKISEAPVTAPEKSKVSDSELATKQIIELLKKVPFELGDAKAIDTIIETARIRKWPIDFQNILKAWITQSLISYTDKKMDNSIIPILTTTIKKQRRLSEKETLELLSAVFERMIPKMGYKTVSEQQLSNEFVQLLLDSLLNEKLITQQQHDSFLKSAVKIVADPELPSIITEHKTNKSAIENRRIESTPEGDQLVNLFDFSTPVGDIGGINVQAQQMPTLSQLEYRGQTPAQVIKELATAISSNYCGYYAAYNIWCIISNRQNDIMDRNLFGQHFAPMIAIIKKNNLQEIAHQGFTAINPELHRYPYDNLAVYEIEYLLKKEFNIDPSTYLTLAEGPQVIYPDSENRSAQARRNALLKSFQTGPFAREKTLAILLNVGGHHWVVIKAKRLGNDLIFEIYDSLGKRNWQDFDAEPPINTNILKNLATYLLIPGTH